MQIDIIICYRLQFLRNSPCKTFHLRSVRISRKFTIQILPICKPHAAFSRFKRRTVQRFYDDDRSCYLLDFQFLCKLDGGLDPYIFTGMNTCCDQHGFSCAMSMQNSHRQSDLTICKLQFPVPLLSRLHRYIFQMKSISFSSCQQKNRRSTVVDDLFLCPDLFPYFFIAGNIKKSCFLHRFNIPLRTFQAA